MFNLFLNFCFLFDFVLENGKEQLNKEGEAVKIDKDSLREDINGKKSMMGVNELEEVAQSLLVLSGSKDWPSATTTESLEKKISTSPISATTSNLITASCSRDVIDLTKNDLNQISNTWTPDVSSFSRSRSFSFNDGLIKDVDILSSSNMTTLSKGKVIPKHEKFTSAFEPISTDDSEDSEDSQFEEQLMRRYSMSMVSDKAASCNWQSSNSTVCPMEVEPTFDGPIDLSKRTEDIFVSNDVVEKQQSFLKATGLIPSALKTPQTEFTSFNQSSATQTSSGEEGKCVCRTCHKSFSKLSQLRLHLNIHYFERPYRCESCGVSFRTKGHLQKHERSGGHFNKVNINLTFGAPTVDNPRPFKCDDCIIAFRIHGHLAKHLRSKAHIMKLECIGKLPCGMFADMERFGISLHEIDTNDCENSLQSLQMMAEKMYSKNGEIDLKWMKQQEEKISRDKLSVEVNSFSPPIQSSSSNFLSESAQIKLESNQLSPVNSAYTCQSSLPSKPLSSVPQFNLNKRNTCSLPSSSQVTIPLTTQLTIPNQSASLDSISATTLSSLYQNSYPASLSISSSSIHPLSAQTAKSQINAFSNKPLSNTLSNFNNSQLGTPLSQPSTDSQSNSSQIISSNTIPVSSISSFSSPSSVASSSLSSSVSASASALASSLASSSSVPSYYSSPSITSLSPLSTTTTTTTIAPTRSNTCSYCNQVFKSAKFLQVHLYCDHQQQPFQDQEMNKSSEPTSPNEDNKPANQKKIQSELNLFCDICRKSFLDVSQFQQVLFI